MKTLLFIVSFFMLTSLSSQTAKEQQSKQSRVENGLRNKVSIAGEKISKANILERMKYYQIQGISIAVINNSKVDWAQGYGHITNNEASAPVDKHTLFQAASISKPITAFGALMLVQEGKISLDEDVNLYLKRWKVPENEFTKIEKVTLRRLLSHTAGTNVDGFTGYSIQTSIPNLKDILEGRKPLVNSDPIRIISKPGTEMKYSGGGTTIVQLLIEDITGEHFDIWMLNNVLMPLGMKESSFKQPLPAAHAAYGHHLDGVPLEGKWHIYPELAAAGLWTTPSDLAQFILYIQTALKSEKSKPLSSTLVKEMLTRQKIHGKSIDSGLGVFLVNDGKNLIFGHDGQNDGFIGRLSGYAYHDHGIVIMVNNDSGWPLIEEIMNSTADAYSWPNYQFIEKRMIPIDPANFTQFLGKYVNEKDEIDITTANNNLFADFKSPYGPMTLYPLSKCTFFILQENLTIEFLNCESKPESLNFTDSKGVTKLYIRKHID
ncbi:MAG: beta-lactamase family protein [Parachlamydiaceae bacterium]|nr:beta-lactamase family protein [Parachlamydiaceae bacterium]